MRTIQMTLDDDLLQAVDEMAAQLHTSRAALTERIFRDALAHHHFTSQEERHRRGYEQYPVGMEEFSVGENERVWGDE